jgi:hypothetical protein
MFISSLICSYVLLFHEEFVVALSFGDELENEGYMLGVGSFFEKSF